MLSKFNKFAPFSTQKKIFYKLKKRFLFKKLNLLLVLLFLGNLVYAQRNCGTDHYHQELMNDSTYLQWYDSVRTELFNSLDLGERGACTINAIPVAVHFNGSVTDENMNCLIEASLTQIAVMNLDFAALNNDIQDYITVSNACPGDFPLGALLNNSCIRFCLATSNHPQGSGLSEGDYAITVGQETWPQAGNEWSGYLNIFVEAISGSLYGLAPIFGALNPDGNGILISPFVFGGPGIDCFSGTWINSHLRLNLGRTGTHEAGHYFGLDHIFAGCNNGDGIDDTPDQDEANELTPEVNLNNCTSDAESCNSLDFFMNYMDYVDDIAMVMFTADQGALMDLTADHNLWREDACLLNDPICDIYLAPNLIETVVSNTCPNQTFDLNSLYPWTLPLGAQLIWSLDSDPSDGVDPISSPNVFQSGVYYAYLYNPIDDCYTDGSSVLVTILSCCNQDYDTYITTDFTIDAPILFHGNLYVESGATLTVNSGLQFPQDKGLIVQSGGKLVLEGSSTMLNKCLDATSWRGVVVEDGGHLEVNEAYIYNAQIGVDAQENSNIDINTIIIFGLNNYTGTGIRLNGNVNAINLYRIKVWNVRNGVYGWLGDNFYHLNSGEIGNVMHGVFMVNNSIILEDYTIGSSDIAVQLANSPMSTLRNNTFGFSNVGISAVWSPFLNITNNNVLGYTASASGFVGIQLFESGGSRIENNPSIKASRLGIRLLQSDAAIVSNTINIPGIENDFGGGIQVNDSHGTQILNNNLNVNYSAFAIETVASSGTDIKGNEIEHASTYIQRTAAIRSMGSMKEEISDNLITGMENTTGIINTNTTSNEYICNDVSDVAVGIGIYYNSEMQNIKGNYLDGAVDLTIFSRIGTQFHHGNYFIGGKARADGLTPDDLLQSRFFVNPSINSNFVPTDPQPASNWFISHSSLNHYSCSSSAVSQWIPFNAGNSTEICDYYEDLKDIQTTHPEQFFVKLLHLLKYGKKTQYFNIPNCILSDSIFLNTCGIKDLVGISVALESIGKSNVDRIPIYDLQDEYENAMTDSARILILGQMKLNLDSVLVVLNNEELLKRNKLDSISTELSRINCSEPIVQKWQSVYMLYTKFLQTDTIALSDRDTLLSLSRECSDIYGDVIHLARSMTNTYSNTYFDINDDCVQNNLLKREKPNETGIIVYPNPSSGVFNLTLPEAFNGILEVSDITGRVVMRKLINKGNLPSIDLTGQKGMLILRFENVNGTSVIRKVIVIE